MSNLLEKAVTLTTPTAYEDGRLLSMKPTVAFGSELVNETTDNISGWVDARSNATLSIVDNNIRATFSSGSTMGASSAAFTTVVGRKYRIKVNANKNNNNGTIYVRVGDSTSVNAAYFNQNNNTDTISVDANFTATATTAYVGILATSQTTGNYVQSNLISIKEDTGADFDFSRGSIATRVNSAFLIEDVATGNDSPRIDYTGGVAHILVEPQSTNGVTYSENFTQRNSISQGSITSNDIISPDGTQNASRFTINNVTPYFAPKHAGFNSGTVYTMSCFVKKGTQRWVRLTNVSSSGTGAWFDLDNNVVGTTSAAVISASITNYGNGWYRISNTLTAANTGNNNFLGLSDDDGTTNVPAEDIGNTVYFWGFQIQEQNVLTSYIPTNGSTVTRLTEAANSAGSSNIFNDSEGVVYAEFSSLANYDTQRYLGLSDGSDTDKVILGFNNSATNYIIVAETKSGNSTTSFMTYDLGTAAPTFVKAAVKYKANDFALWVDGTERATDSSGGAPVGLSELALDRGNGANDFEGKLGCLAVYNEALSDDLLECLTGEGSESFATLVLRFNYTII